MSTKPLHTNAIERLVRNKLPGIVADEIVSWSGRKETVARCLAAARKRAGRALTEEEESAIRQTLSRLAAGGTQ